MNAGRAVIVSDEVGAAPDLVRDGVNGYVIPVGDVAALTNRLADVLKTPNTIRSMGDESLKIINQWGFREDLIGLEEALGAVVGGTRQQ
jgi:glycosyltransferase involved in cell wall biosynthesis